MVRVTNSNILSAFDEKTVGSKVVDRGAFSFLLIKAIEQHDFTRDRTPGQTVLDLTLTANLMIIRKCVSGGIGRKTNNPDDYVIRIYRDSPHMFLHRKCAEPVSFLKTVVYTKEAYLNDPDVLSDPVETKRIQESDATHVLVAILAGAVDSFVSPFRFIANLSGQNHDYEKMTVEELKLLAQKVKEHSENWLTVAD